MSTIREEKKKKTISIEKNREEVKEKALFQLSPGGMRYGKAVMLRGGGGALETQRCVLKMHSTDKIAIAKKILKIK